MELFHCTSLGVRMHVERISTTGEVRAHLSSRIPRAVLAAGGSLPPCALSLSAAASSKFPRVCPLNFAGSLVARRAQSSN